MGNLPKKLLLSWGALLGCLLSIEVVATVLIPKMREVLYNGIEKFDWLLFVHGLWLFAVLWAHSAFVKALSTTQDIE